MSSGTSGSDRSADILAVVALVVITAVTVYFWSLG